MTNGRNIISAEDGDSQITLGLLAAVEADNATTQRSMADQLGVALGLVNAYLRRCVTKGWIKVRAAPANRYAYYLTPKGFREKSRLTAEYLRQSFSLFRQAREQYAALIAECAEQGLVSIACMGASDLTEIVCLMSASGPIKVIAIVDPVASAETNGIPQFSELAEAGAVDAVIVTDIQDPDGAYAAACRVLSPGRVFMPQLLQFTPRRQRSGLH
jgi:DNA-binding MarR family transcriptional regulator